MGSEDNTLETLSRLRDAAEQGDASAQYRLGVMYEEGFGVPEDDAQAVAWIRRAADQGHPTAQNYIGARYDHGLGFTTDEPDWYRRYRKWAEQGEACGQWSLGYAYEYGLGVEKNQYEAVRWYRKAAEQGDSDAELSLGDCYENGKGVEKDEREAERWYLDAAARGHWAAGHSLGLLYLTGKGIDKSGREAVRWLCHAAELGYPDAQELLAEIYEQGRVVPRDMSEARRWLEKVIVNEYSGRSKVRNAKSGIDRIDRKEAKKEASAGTMRMIEGMIGLGGVKVQIQSLADRAKTQIMRRAAGLKSPGVSLHLVFTGNPGTGKTTVARYIGKIYAELGFLAKGHLVEAQRQDLIGEYIGHTAPKVKAKIVEALDGVLFIDEAYSLAPPYVSNDFGAEAVATLIAEMENQRDRLAIIVAGYPVEMKRFIDMNPGLSSRFTRYIEFEDYQPSELTKIFVKFAQESDYRLDEGVQAALLQHFTAIYAMRGKNFGNARDVRNLFEQAVERHATRVCTAELRDRESLALLTTSDLPI